VKQQEDKLKLSVDGEGSGRKASGGRPCAANCCCGEKPDEFTMTAEEGFFFL